LTDANVGLFYRDYYRGKNSPFYIDFTQLKNPIRLSSRSLSQVLLAKQFVDFKKNDVFLDFGPGDGSSFMSAISILPSPKMYAVELNKNSSIAYKDAYGISTFENLDQIEDNGIKAKIIILSHSFEHIKLTQLPYFLEKIKNIVDEDGILLIEVPLVDMRKHELLRSQDAPHFLFFSLDSVQMLFERHGWKIIFLNSTSNKYNHNRSSEKIQKKNFYKIFSNIAGKILKKMPIFVVRMISKYINNISFDENFSYGGDRTCIRLVLKK